MAEAKAGVGADGTRIEATRLRGNGFVAVLSRSTLVFPGEVAKRNANFMETVG
jgi:hypothetical protein